MVSTSMATRIQKVMAHLGYGSRRHCEELIRAGRVTLDGRVLEIGESLSDEESGRLEVDGRVADSKPEKLYLLLNKPTGFVTTVSDPQGRSTVMSLLPEGSLMGAGRLYPVGRLDRATEGALLFTNDGDLVHRLLHPSSGVEKEYRAKTSQAPKELQLERLRGGPELEDGPTQRPRAVWTAKGEVFMVLKEGRKHQVRRMLKAVGLNCTYLERQRFANLTLAGLKRGATRRLTDLELQELRRLAEGL